MSHTSLNNVGGFGFRSWTYNQVVEVGRIPRIPDNCTAIWLIFPVEFRGTVQIFLVFFAEILSFFARLLYLIMKNEQFSMVQRIHSNYQPAESFKGFGRFAVSIDKWARVNGTRRVEEDKRKI